MVVKFTLRLQTLTDLVLIGLCWSEGDGIALCPQCSSLGKGERLSHDTHCAYQRLPYRLSVTSLVV